MKKRLSVLLAVLLLLSGLVAARAESPYVPGRRGSDLLSAALDAGHVVTYDARLHLDADWAALAGDEETARLLPLAMGALKNAHLRVGFGKFDGGARLTLGAAYEQENADPVEVFAAVNFTWDGLNVESDLLPGKRFTVGWETLLEEADVDPSVIEAFYSARDNDDETSFEAEMQTLVEELTPIVEALAPYGSIVAEHLSSLNVETQTDVPATDAFPAADQVYVVSVTSQDVASLLVDLLDHAESDPIFTENLKSQDFASWRAAAEEIDASNGLFKATVGLDEGGDPCFIDLYATDNADFTATVTGALHPTDAGSRFVLGVTADSQQDGEESSAAFSMAISSADDPVIDKALDGEVSFEITSAGKSLYSMNDTFSVAGEKQGEEPGSVTQMQDTHCVSTDSGLVRVVTQAKATSALTAEGGETAHASGTVDTYVDENGPVTVGISSENTIRPEDGEGVSGDFSLALNVPTLHVDDLGLTVTYASAPYDPASADVLTEIAIETLSQEDLEALTDELSTAATQKVFALLSALPQELFSELMSSAQ